MGYYRETRVRANFTDCNVKAGKIVLKFEVGGDDRYTLPTLALLTGEKVTLEISSDQQVMLLDAATGEIVDNETEQPPIELEQEDGEASEGAEEEELPPAAQAYDDELDEIFGADAA